MAKTVKREDKRTALEITEQRYRHLLDLPDRDLCLADHRTSALPVHAREKPCTYQWITDAGTVECCPHRRLWVTKTANGLVVRCTAHMADLIRARLWLERRALQRRMNR